MERDGKRPVGGRRGLRAAVTVVGLLIACVLAASAGAAVVTIGTPTASFVAGQSSAGCNCTQYQLTAPPGYVETVPAAGVIIGWRVAGTGTLTLEALRTASDGQLSIVGLSTPGQTASTGAFALQPVHIPVLAGDSIGVHLSGSSPKVFNTGPLAGAVIGEASPDVPARAPNLQTPGGAIFLNADVALTPVVTGIAPASGPTGGGTVVTITGQFLDGTTSVKFGALNASSFTVISPTEIIAASPIQAAGTLDIRVSGPGAASATSTADQFTYTAPPTPISPVTSAPTPVSTGEPPAKPGSALVLSPLALSASYFRAAPSGPSIASTATGTTVRYTVSAAATTRFTIQKAVPGRLLPATPSSHGLRTCVAPTRAAVARKLPACSRYVSLSPQLTHLDGPGLNSVHLTGRLNGHALAPGSYRLLASAISTATPTTVSASVTHSFHILGPPAPKKAAAPTAHASLPSAANGTATGTGTGGETLAGQTGP
jgi:hypothetical protein